MKEKFDVIWDSFHKDLGRLVGSKISYADDAHDVLQDIFVKIYKNIDTIDSIDNLKAWIYKITTNTITDYYKKAKLDTVSIEGMQIGQENQDDESFNNEISKCLSLFIQELSDSDGEIITKAHYGKVKHKDIASELNISEANSKMKLSRAKKKLKKMLSDCCDFEVDKYGNIISYTQKNNYDCE